MARWPLWFLELLLVPAAHVLVAPYTKVEESFTLHAAYDVLRYGLSPANWEHWDHRTFPGAVPRSFLPPIVLGLLSYPSAALASATGLVATSIGIQVIVRLTLVACFAAAFTHLARTLQRRYSTSTADWFVALTLAQFHIPFYAGRTLPNFTALPLVVLAFSYLLDEKLWAGIALLTATATVIRLEVALLAVPTALALVVQRRLSLPAALGAGIAGGFGALALSAPLDYALWAPTLPHPSLPDFTALHTLWPELSAAHWNIAHGHAAEWGTMPAHLYVSALLKMLAGAAPLLLLGVVWALLLGLSAKSGHVLDNTTLRRTVASAARTLGPGVVCLVAVLSTVGHKEWRFIVYAIPPLNIVAAACAAALAALPRRALRALSRLALTGLLGITAAFALFSTYVSTHNYPGGCVWRALEAARLPHKSTIHFHSYPLQTGASLFTFVRGKHASPAFPAPVDVQWVYSKSEEPSLQTPQGAWLADLDAVVTERWREFAGAEIDGHKMWALIGACDGFDGVHFGKEGVQVRTSPKIGLLRRL
ncbi:hypothetical protein CC85DRAFT_327138 [Cutaneotrichosporon oleaginosum]|uniref:Mannosyltransferase n=1 Tax=Cutaneotrichosporon oleaginosum TaxID=879819 RepID=A0A0J0XR68_9TREE|nr:uncharacterized protein CC85DRAFT_327138 [Cutaneotrichosporon oleaginosum]KLT43588.1 hypothetical protein CC85DRAFT_327138 [Cutaneotrichosporon oleaginosum]TXT12743.1 hypothetical protein COLE_03153 [Cutaneotrichosporon oleaginosum]